jgi:hypothetical protein
MSYPKFGKRVSASATGIEQRRSARRPGSVDGKILVSQKKFLRCSIVDVSNKGALLIVANMQAVPDTFKLEDDVGRRRTVRVTRRGKTRLGVAFD